MDRNLQWPLLLTQRQTAKLTSSGSSTMGWPTQILSTCPCQTSKAKTATNPAPLITFAQNIIPTANTRNLPSTVPEWNKSLSRVLAYPCWTKRYWSVLSLYHNTFSIVIQIFSCHLTLLKECVFNCSPYFSSCKTACDLHLCVSN